MAGTSRQPVMPRPSSTEPPRKPPIGAQSSGPICSDPADAATDADVVMVCVGNDDDVRSVVLGDAGVLGAMKAGSTPLITPPARRNWPGNWVVTATTGASRSLMHRCPVRLGRKPQPTVMVGATRRLSTRCRYWRSTPRKFNGWGPSEPATHQDGQPDLHCRPRRAIEALHAECAVSIRMPLSLPGSGPELADGQPPPNNGPGRI